MNGYMETDKIDPETNAQITARVHAVAGATLFLAGNALELTQALLEKDSKHLAQTLRKYHAALEQAINTFDELDLYVKEM